MNIDIKDRVAVGDNKYTMRTLSDGRVELTPSPDSVQEPGTPLNKALFQPMADSAYDVIYSLNWYPEEDNRLAFSNAKQTLSGLVADLNANKNVGIKIKKAGATVYVNAELIGITAYTGYAIRLFDSYSASFFEFNVHRWDINKDYFNNYEFLHDGVNISEELHSVKIANVNQSDNINALIAYAQILNDRITALESKIS